MRGRLCCPGRPCTLQGQPRDPADGTRYRAPGQVTWPLCARCCSVRKDELVQDLIAHHRTCTTARRTAVRDARSGAETTALASGDDTGGRGSMAETESIAAPATIVHPGASGDLPGASGACAALAELPGCSTRARAFSAWPTRRSPTTIPRSHRARHCCRARLGPEVCAELGAAQGRLSYLTGDLQQPET